MSESIYSGLEGKDLPVELMDAITSEVQGVITKEQAEEIRLELMKERSKMIDTNTNDKYESFFNMWCVSAFFKMCYPLLTLKQRSEH